MQILKQLHDFLKASGTGDGKLAIVRDLARGCEADSPGEFLELMKERGIPEGTLAKVRDFFAEIAEAHIAEVRRAFEQSKLDAGSQQTTPSKPDAGTGATGQQNKAQAHAQGQPRQPQNRQQRRHPENTGDVGQSKAAEPKSDEGKIADGQTGDAGEASQPRE